jgi:hypothetical protein
MWKQVWFCIKNYKRLYSENACAEKRREEAASLTYELKCHGYTWRIGDPACDIGTALDLANNYKVEIQRGTCYGDCVAFILKQDWQYELYRGVCSFAYGTWTYREPDQIEDIAAWGHSVQVAVCKCLINAAVAGVLRPSEEDA